MCTNAGDFNERAPWRKAGRARGGFQRFGGRTARSFADGAAAFANQEDYEIAGAMIVHAGDEGVAAFDAVNESIVAEKFECPINRDWCRTRLLLQPIDNFIGAQRTVAGEQNFKHLTPHRR